MLLSRPDMVFFDYGGTLIDEGHFSEVDAMRTLLACADHPEDSDVQTLLALWRETSGIIDRRTHPDGVGLEIPLLPALNCILARAGLTTSLPPLELEIAFHRGNAVHKAMPGAGDCLARLRALGVRTAVISNLAVSGAALRVGIADCLPEHTFEFVMASADYVFCKPSPLLFDAAIRKAGVDPTRCWFCGNDPTADILGSARAGMFPILLDTRMEADFTADCLPESSGNRPFLRVKSWQTLNSLMQQL